MDNALCSLAIHGSLNICFFKVFDLYCKERRDVVSLERSVPISTTAQAVMTYVVWESSSRCQHGHMQALCRIKN